MKALPGLDSPPFDPTLYLDRDISLLAFNARVLAQAENRSLPLMERLRFLCITSSNIDEFFEVRVASIRARGESGARRSIRDVDALLDNISKDCHTLIEKQYAILNQEILPQLADSGIRLLTEEELNEKQRAWVKDFFDSEIRPVLTPIVLDPAHPFPRVLNKSLHFIISLSGKDAFGRGNDVAIIKAPRVLPRVIRLPEDISPGVGAFTLLSSIIQMYLPDLLPQRDIVACSQFRVTRDSDLWVDEEEVKNLKEALRSSLSNRHYGRAVRLEVAHDCPAELADFLLNQFDLDQRDIYYANGPVNMVRLLEMLDHINDPKLFFQKYTPSAVALSRRNSLFEALRGKDILLHHPFQSFQTVIDFIRQAAHDPDVLVIKQTIYRAGVHSELMESLIAAAQRGKEVLVVVELKARFDEERNIDWAGRLQEAGAQVVYGVMGLKTHAKLALVIRRENGVLRYYAHMGTGNYNPNTARIYTDFGLLTANEKLAGEVNEVFIRITSLTRPVKLDYLWMAPFELHRGIIRSIQNEARLVKQGKKGRIIAKVNSLIDESVIQALYAASSAGVKIDLIVRGACALKPGVSGLSDNIRVYSIVGRYLEHSRIYYFRNNLKHDVYLSSADWMARNLFRRVEIAFPILDKALKKRILQEGLLPYLKDNQNTWKLCPDGTYRRKKAVRSQWQFSAQQYLMSLYGASPVSAVRTK
ncbi:MAG: polyphosphate kinase 1 [Burkholderiaceae bacterium]|jgi:polyphosphate kinase|nr:polyphosphate kinase 1 [Burkholderiaceae bacterium]